VVLVVGTLIILQTLGVAITPLIGALGIGSLAVALALQDTLSNLFAGFYIVLSKQIKIGDYIKLDSGEEGYVVDIDWRSTKTRTIFNNIILIPNAKLAQSIVTNYFVYDKKMMLRIPIGVSYESDPEKVEKVLIEEVEKAVGEVNGLLKEPRPFVRFIPGFGDFSLDFTLYCAVREFRDQYHVQHELRKRIFKRFKKEGIEIPFPIRTLYLKKES
jgi:small-conductance mechanosensitive channel